MIAALVCAFGMPAAFLLLGRVRTCSPARAPVSASVSIVIPARNEEQNLPRLLNSLTGAALPTAEVLVVDDGSTDNTAAVARALGAHVLCAAPPPAGWSGKTWACHQGAQQASGELLLFLDADTWFMAGGLERLIANWSALNDSTVVFSLLPWHDMPTVSEQLSLFFNVLMASAGFAVFAEPRIFGQSLLISRAMYFSAGGHAPVRGKILENFNLTEWLRMAGARLRCLSGAGTLHMRMFPEGGRQMFASWSKGFAQGAAASEKVVQASSVVWISALWSAVVLLLLPFDYGRAGVGALYLLLGLQLAWLSRRLGNFHPLVCLLYPIPLAYFCAVFGVSLARGVFGLKTEWRGREV